MKFSTWGRLGGLAGAMVVAVAFATPSMMGKVEPKAFVFGVIPDGPEKERALALLRERGQPSPMIADFSFHNLNAVAIAGAVAVDADVDVYDTRDDVSYLWRVVARPKADKTTLVFETFYHERRFRPVPGERFQPNFGAIVDLAPGTYIIEVSLIEVPDGFAVEALEDEETANAQRVLAGFREVTVAAD